MTRRTTFLRITFSIFILLMLFCPREFLQQDPITNKGTRRKLEDLRPAPRSKIRKREFKTLLRPLQRLSRRPIGAFYGDCWIATLLSPSFPKETKKEKKTKVDKQTRRVLHLYKVMGKDSLDLHTLFEAGGNDPKARQKVLDIVVELIDGGYLEPHGSDFYDITAKGQAVLGDP